MSKLQSFFQSMQGTEWQSNMLFLQQNTETYRWVFVGVTVGLFIISGVLLILLGRFKGGMNVCAMGFVPVIRWGIPLILILRGILGVISGLLSGLSEKKTKNSLDEGEEELGLDDEFEI